MAFARPQGSAARSRSREQGASPFAHVPRSLAPPATSPRRSPQLRFVPADPVAHVLRKAQETCSLAPKDVASARKPFAKLLEATLSLSCAVRAVLGAAKGLRERYLRLQRVRRKGERCDGLLLQELQRPRVMSRESRTAKAVPLTQALIRVSRISPASPPIQFCGSYF